jgi:hypothetical protein
MMVTVKYTAPAASMSSKYVRTSTRARRTRTILLNESAQARTERRSFGISPRPPFAISSGRMRPRSLSTDSEDCSAYSTILEGVRMYIQEALSHKMANLSSSLDYSSQEEFEVHQNLISSTKIHTLQGSNVVVAPFKAQPNLTKMRKSWSSKALIMFMVIPKDPGLSGQFTVQRAVFKLFLMSTRPPSVQQPHCMQMILFTQTPPESGL